MANHINKGKNVELTNVKEIDNVPSRMKRIKARTEKV